MRVRPIDCRVVTQRIAQRIGRCKTYRITGVTIDAPGATVVLRGLSINGQGGRFATNLHAASRLRVENCVVSNMADNGIWQDAAGAELVAPTGYSSIRMSENAVLNNFAGGVLANGNAANIYIASNTFNNNLGGCELVMQNTGAVYSIGNNPGSCGLPQAVSGY